MLYLVGLGLHDEKDISVKGLEAIKRCKHVYLETYTSLLGVSVSKLETYYKKKLFLANRDLVEAEDNEILTRAKKEPTALLIIGDVFSATTHVDLFLRACNEKINVNVINNASILTAVGVTGLSLYKFGQTTSIPFHHTQVTTPIEVYKKNKKLGFHTLILLDLDPINKKYLSAKEAANYFLKNKITDNCIACYQLGSPRQEICYTNLNKVKESNQFPQCLIIPGNLHFMEEEILNTLYKC